MLLLALFGAITAGCMAWGITRIVRQTHNSRTKAGEVTAIVVPLVVLLIMCFTHIGVYSGNLTTIANLEATQVASLRNYEITAERSIDLLSSEEVKALLVAGSIEKLSLGTDVVARLVEHRDTAVEFNKDLAGLRAMKINLWVSIMVPEIPENLEYLTIDGE